MSNNINLYIIGSAPFDNRVQIPSIDDVDILHNIIFKNNNLTIYLIDPNYKNNISSEIEYFDVHSVYFIDFLSKNPMNNNDYYIIIDFIGNSNILDLLYTHEIEYNEKIIFIPCECSQNNFCYSLLLKPFVQNDYNKIIFLQYNLFEKINLNIRIIDSLQNIFEINYQQIISKIMFAIKNNNLMECDLCSNIYFEHKNYILELNKCLEIHKLYIKNSFDTIKNHIFVLISIIKHIFIEKYLHLSYMNYGIYHMHKYLFDEIINNVEHYYFLLLYFLKLNNIKIIYLKIDEIKKLCESFPNPKMNENVNSNEKQMDTNEISLAFDETKAIDKYFLDITKLIGEYFNLFYGLYDVI